MPQKVKGAKSGFYFLTFSKEKRDPAGVEPPASVKFAIAGKEIVVKRGGVSSSPLPYKEAITMVAKSRRWTNNALIDIAPAVAGKGTPDGGKNQGGTEPDGEALTQAQMDGMAYADLLAKAVSLGCEVNQQSGKKVVTEAILKKQAEG